MSPGETSYTKVMFFESITFHKKVTKTIIDFFRGVTQFCNALLLKVTFPNNGGRNDAGIFN